jgi:hypothetical protein
LFLRSFPCTAAFAINAIPREARNEISKNEHDSGENTKKPSNTAWTADENERLRQLIISNASVIDIAADLGRTVKAVRARAHRLRIALGRSRFRVKAN